jgi:hypothetical protein
MSTKPQIGGNIYNDELEQLRHAAEQIRQALSQLVEEPGEKARALLIAKAAVELNKIQASLIQLDRIGRDTKGK